MGKRGPKPQRAKTKAMRGNPGKRAVEIEEPEADVSSGTLRLPQKLSVDERKVWNDLRKAFPDWYFTPADKHLLVAYCRTVVRIDISERALKNTSAVDKRGNGGPCLNQHFRVISESLKQLAKLSELLDLTRARRRSAGLAAGETPQAIPHSEPDGEEVGDIPDHLIARPQLVQTG